MAAPFFILSNKGTSQIIVTKSSPILIPKDLFDPQHIEDYLKLQFDLSQAGHIICNEIEDYISLTYLDKEENDCLLQLSPRQYQHISTFLHHIIHRKAFNKHPHSLCVSIQEGQIHYFLEKDNKLLLVNNIGITSDYDILYHLLNILKQHEIKTDDFMVYLHNGSDTLTELLSEYFDVTLLRIL